MTDLGALLTAALRDACGPVEHLCYSDITDGHAVAGAKDGRAIRADGRDVQALIVSSRFEGQSALERQQLVNSVLGPTFKRPGGWRYTNSPTV